MLNLIPDPPRRSSIPYVIMSAIYALHAVALAANKGGLLEPVLNTEANLVCSVMLNIYLLIQVNE